MNECKVYWGDEHRPFHRWFDCDNEEDLRRRAQEVANELGRDVSYRDWEDTERITTVSPENE